MRENLVALALEDPGVPADLAPVGLEVRIVPTDAVAANTLSPFQTVMDWTGIPWLLNSLSGIEVARMGGAGPLRFLWDILIPLSKTNIAALATIMFVYAWNQYLWPLLFITDRANYGVVVVQLSDLVPDQLTTGGSTPTWHLAMAATLVAMLPPIAVVNLVQRWFVRGLINTDK